MSGPQSVIENPDWIAPQDRAMAVAKAMDGISAALPTYGPGSEYRNAILHFVSPNRGGDVKEMHGALSKAVEPVNAAARLFRKNTRHYQTTSPSGTRLEKPIEEVLKGGAIAKSALDVGTLTNFASITGGQSLGYVSLDTQLARATVRPSSFTLYQALNKSAAFQVVDYWAYLDDTGGALPGAAFASFTNVSSGTLTTNVGRYSLQNLNLKLMVDGRAMTTALAAQNSFVDVATQESTNAALTILSTANWAAYWGNPTIFPNQFSGLANLIPAANTFNFQTFYNGIGTAEGWSKAQALYNLIYEASAQITSWATFGQITHAFMSPDTNASLQGLVTTTLNNILTIPGRGGNSSTGIVVNGDLQGMRTRFGEIQFVLDLFINARLAPAQSFVRADGTTPATTSGPTAPSGFTAATVAASAVTQTSYWTSAYAPTGASNTYVYAVAGMGQNTEESTLAYTSVVSGVPAGGAVTLTINPAAANDATAVRIYRSGLSYSKTTTGNTPYSFRLIATVATTGTSAITYTDYNANIPGAETIFLLDLAEEDNALDWRFLLPMTRISLFAQTLIMPWAVAMIGAVRVKIPKFHGMVTQYVADEPNWNPLAANN